MIRSALLIFLGLATPQEAVIAAQAAPLLDLRRRPDFSFDNRGSRGATGLSGVAGGARLLTGSTLAIADAGANLLYFVNIGNRSARSVGRRGDGPGEFREIRWMATCANGNVAVHDGARAHLSLWGADGLFRTVTPLPAGLNYDQVVWCSGTDRLFVLLTRPRVPRVEPGQALAVPTALLSIQGGRVDTVRSTGLQDYYVGKATAAFGAVPLGRRVLAAAAGDRLFVCGSHDGRCLSIQVERPLSVGTFALPLARRALRSGDWKAAVTAEVDADPSPAVRRRLAALFNEIAPVTTFPLIDQIRGDAAGNLWVKTFDDFGTPNATWVVVTSTGTRVGTVLMRSRFRPLEIGVDYLLGVALDQDDVETV